MKTNSFAVVFIALCLAAQACNLPVRMSIPTGTPLLSPTPAVTPSVVAPVATPIIESTSSATAALPDTSGLQLVYTSGNNIFLWKEGASVQLTSSGDAYAPLISPDGKLIAFSRPVDDYHLEIWSIQSDGKNERKLCSVADLDAIGAGVRDPSAMAIIPNTDYYWLPETHILAFTTQQIFQGPGSSLLDDLNLVEADTGVIKNLFLPGSGGMFVYSPDGKKIAISQPDKIIIANDDGSEYQTVLTYDPVITYSEYRFYAQPVWSPAGDDLMVAIPPADPLSETTRMTELWRIQADGTVSHKLGAFETVAFMEQPVVFSPDLNWIAYLKETGAAEQNQRELHVAATDGSDDRLIQLASPIFFQGWSPDSDHFIYSVGQTQTVWLGSREGVSEPLAEGMTGAQSVRWIDDRQFFYWLPNQSALELFLGSVDGTSLSIARTIDSRPYLSFIH